METRTGKNGSWQLILVLALFCLGVAWIGQPPKIAPITEDRFLRLDHESGARYYFNESQLVLISRSARRDVDQGTEILLNGGHSVRTSLPIETILEQLEIELIE